MKRNHQAGSRFLRSLLIRELLNVRRSKSHLTNSAVQFPSCFFEGVGRDISVDVLGETRRPTTLVSLAHECLQNDVGCAFGASANSMY